MNIQERIEKQRQIIYELLTPLIDCDYLFIDLPYYSNIGDTLIWKGTETFLSSLSYKCLLKASFQTFSFPQIEQDTVIVMMGGGNWGDLYAPHNKLRRDVVEHYPDNKIIILPQTVYYEGARNACADAKVFRKHKKLTICARDRYSYNFLRRFDFSKNIVLVPDMAFCIDNEALRQLSCKSTGKDLVFKRVDKEQSSMSVLDRYLSGRRYDISDWPLYEGNDHKADRLYALLKAERLLDADRYAIETYLPERFREGVEHISKYERVFSNRLHGAILAILLGKETFILDNSYGKNSQYYNTWLKGTDNIHLMSVNKPMRIKRKIRFLLHWLRAMVTKDNSSCV